MFVVRLKLIDSSLKFQAFTSRLLALSSFEAGQSQVIDGRLDESTLFDVAAACDAKTAIQSVREGRASLLQIYPRPMTEAEAAAFLADLDLEELETGRNCSSGNAASCVTFCR
jgi:hypothetical protein